MTVVANLAIVLATIVATEWAARWIHQFVMHGPGWGWHKSHHEQHNGVLEKNDLYAIGFAAVAVSLLVLAPHEAGSLYWIGVGMSVYGFLYFVVHDGMTHGRWPLRYVPRRGYLKRLVQAHRLHHAIATRSGAVSFGFLYAPSVRTLRRQLREQRTRETVPSRVEQGRPEERHTGLP